ERLIDKTYLGEPPIEDRKLAERTEHDVRGLQVAVNDAALMNELDGLTGALKGLQQTATRVRGLRAFVARAQSFQDVVQRAAGEALHREVFETVGSNAEIVDGQDRRMFELTLDLRLEKKARAQLGSSSVFRTNQLHRDGAADSSVGAESHFAHAA